MVSEKHVLLTMERIYNESPILAEMAENGEIKIAGAMYDVSTGAINFI